MAIITHLVHADSQTLLLLIVLCLVVTPALLVGLVGYLFYVRHATRPAREIADRAHQEVLNTLQGQSDLAAIQGGLMKIERTLNVMVGILHDVQQDLKDLKAHGK
jgi:hypothetical protein